MEPNATTRNKKHHFFLGRSVISQAVRAVVEYENILFGHAVFKWICKLKKGKVKEDEVSSFAAMTMWATCIQCLPLITFRVQSSPSRAVNGNLTMCWQSIKGKHHPSVSQSRLVEAGSRVQSTNSTYQNAAVITKLPQSGDWAVRLICACGATGSNSRPFRTERELIGHKSRPFTLSEGEREDVSHAYAAIKSRKSVFKFE